jgi:hypothetical protein
MIFCFQDNENSYAPKEVVSIVASLERSAYEAFHPEFEKYNQKMRSLLFNIEVWFYPGPLSGLCFLGTSKSLA